MCFFFCNVAKKTYSEMVVEVESFMSHEPMAFHLLLEAADAFRTHRQFAEEKSMGQRLMEVSGESDAVCLHLVGVGNDVQQIHNGHSDLPGVHGVDHRQKIRVHWTKYGTYMVNG